MNEKTLELVMQTITYIQDHLDKINHDLDCLKKILSKDNNNDTEV